MVCSLPAAGCELIGSHRVIMNRLTWYLDRKSTGKPQQSFRLFSYGKNTFLFVFMRILPHILGDSPVSQIKIIQEAIGQWFSILWLHIYFFFLWRCTALCNEWKSTDTRLAKSVFIDLFVFHKTRGVYGLKITPKKSPFQATCGCQRSSQSWYLSQIQLLKTIFWKHKLPRAVNKTLCSLPSACVVWDRIALLSLIKPLPFISQCRYPQHRLHFNQRGCLPFLRVQNQKHWKEEKGRSEMATLFKVSILLMEIWRDSR